jgi:hypothetical protein
VQLFFDTRRELGEDVTRGFREWQDISKWAFSTLNDCIAYGPDAGEALDAYHAQKLAPLRSDIHRRTNQDECRDMMAAAQYAPEHIPIEKHMLMRIHTMHSGLQPADLLEQMHARAILLHSERNAVLPLAHLYNAARESGHLPPTSRWKDLEYIIEKQGEDFIYGSTAPLDPSRWVKQYLLASGYDKKAVAKLTSWERSVLQALRHPPKTAKLWHPMARSVDLLQKSKGTAQGTIPTSRTLSNNIDQIVHQYLEDQQQTTLRSTKSPKISPSTCPLTPQQTLHIYTQAAQDDELALTFDHLAFHRQCQSLLRLIQTSYLANADQIDQSYTGDKHLPTITALLLHQAARATATTPASPSPSKEFEEACHLLRAHIDKYGSTQLDAAKVRIGIEVDTEGPRCDTPAWFDDMQRPEDFIMLADRGKFEGGRLDLGWKGWVVEQGADGRLRWILKDERVGEGGEGSHGVGDGLH